MNLAKAILYKNCKPIKYSRILMRLSKYIKRLWPSIIFINSSKKKLRILTWVRPLWVLAFITRRSLKLFSTLILKRPILTTRPSKTIQKDKISNFMYKNLYLTKNKKNSLQFSKIVKTKSNSRSKPTIKMIWKIKQNTKRTKNQTQNGLQSKLSKSIKISKAKNLLQLKNKPDNEELQSTIDAATSSAIQE